MEPSLILILYANYIAQFTVTSESLEKQECLARSLQDRFVYHRACRLIPEAQQVLTEGSNDYFEASASGGKKTLIFRSLFFNYGFGAMQVIQAAKSPRFPRPASNNLLF